MPDKQREPEVLMVWCENENHVFGSHPRDEYCVRPIVEKSESAAPVQPVPPRNKRIQELCAKLQRESNDDYQCPHKPSCKELEDAAPSPVLTQPSALKKTPQDFGTCKLSAHPEHWVHSWEFHDLLLDFANAEEDGETTNAHAAIKAYIIARASSPAKVAPDWRSMCIVEIATENQSVRDYVIHWEGRTKSAEAKVEQLKKDLAAPAVAQHKQEREDSLAKISETAERVRSQPEIYGNNRISAPAVARRTQGDADKLHTAWMALLVEDRTFGGSRDHQLFKLGYEAALRESASLHNPSDSETKAAKLKLYDLWCQAGSEDFTQWLAEKAIELFAGRESTREAPSDGCASKYHRPTAIYCLDCLPKDAPLGALLLSNRKPTQSEIERGLEIQKLLDERSASPEASSDEIEQLVGDVHAISQDFTAAVEALRDWAHQYPDENLKREYADLLGKKRGSR